MKKLKNISVTFLTEVKNHHGNGGDNFMGNASVQKKIDNKSYFSGQMNRWSLFHVMEDLNENDDTNTYFSTPDSTPKIDIMNIETIFDALKNDVALDMRGTLIPISNNIFKRESVVHAAPAVAINQSRYIMDLLLRFDRSKKSNINDIVKVQLSLKDEMIFNFSLDTKRLLAYDNFKKDALNFTKKEKVDKGDKETKKSKNEKKVKNNSKENIEMIEYLEPAIKDENEFIKEKKRRIILFLGAIEHYHGFANQARNAFNPKPKEMLILFDHITHDDDEPFDYFQKTLEERKAFLDYCQYKGFDYLLYDKLLANNLTEEEKQKYNVSVNIYEVFKNMYNLLDNYDLTI